MTDSVAGSLEAELLNEVERRFESEQVPWLRELVERPSHTHAREDVERAAAWVDGLASDLGLQRTLHADPSERFADHRVFRSPTTAEDTVALALVGHVDTVFPRSMGFLEFVRDPADSDVIRGPGVLDMKSGLSAILFAIRAVKTVVPDFFAAVPLRFVCNTDEEVGSPSSGILFTALADLTAKALVFESGREGDRIVTRRKGGGIFQIVAHGRSAHAGNDHASGTNAIHALARLIDPIEAMTDYDRGITLNVGLFAGGTAKNTVPDRADCTIDARFVTLADAHRVVAELERLTSAPLEGDPTIPDRLRSVRFELRGGVTRPPMEASDASQRLRAEYESCARRVGLGTGEAPLQGGGSDANLLAARGVPCIDGLGPYGRFFHQPGEWSSLKSLCRRTQALACFLARQAESNRGTLQTASRDENLRTATDE